MAKRKIDNDRIDEVLRKSPQHVGCDKIELSTRHGTIFVRYNRYEDGSVVIWIYEQPGKPIFKLDGTAPLEMIHHIVEAWYVGYEFGIEEGRAT